LAGNYGWSPDLIQNVAGCVKKIVEGAGLPGARLRIDDSLDRLFRMDNITVGVMKYAKQKKEATLPP